MRFKTFTASTIAEAMKLVSQSLGDEAVIVATDKGPQGKGVRVTAAVENIHFALPHIPEHDMPLPPSEDPYDVILSYLERHGTPTHLSNKLLRAATAIPTTNPKLALASAFDRFFTFLNITHKDNPKPLMFVGPPGTGKTIAVAKIVARAVMDREPVRVITTDNLKAGGVEQLSFLTSIMGLDLSAVKSPAGLLKAVFDDPLEKGLIIVDTNAVNPYAKNELTILHEYIDAIGADPILVLPAGGDTGETTDIASAFQAIGVDKILITRVDVTRRLGSVLTAVEQTKMHFTEISISPLIALGLTAITPVSLSKLVLSDPSQLINNAFNNNTK